MLKRFAWFVFKAPQRKLVGFGTLLTDLRGAVSILLNLLLPKKRQAIWICTGNFNRSKALLNFLIRSMSEAENKEMLALSVVDCGSTDIQNLEEEIRKIWAGELVFSSTYEPFSRSKAFNRAIRQSKGEFIFVCDADISLPKNLPAMFSGFVSKRVAWFPVCQWQKQPDSPKWKWLTAGTGVFGASKTQLNNTGLYDESFTEWGKEDWELFFRFYKNGIMPLRNRVKGLWHHWHPSSQPENYKPLF